MLGVLAIVGVLSVGAIAGYSKAMFKHKLNKQSQQIEQLVTGMIEYKSIAKNWNNGEYFTSYYKKLGFVPKEMIKDSTNFLYDVFNISMLIGPNDNSANVFSTVWFRSLHQVSIDACVNLFNIAKSYPNEMWSVGINATGFDDTNHQEWYYGNQQRDCSSVKCIRTMDMSTIYDLCEVCVQDQYCGVYYHLRN